MPTHTQRMALARLSLEGLSVGDALGERFFTHRSTLANLPAANSYADLKSLRLSRPPWAWTDDTAMAIAIVEELEQHQAIQPDSLARRFSERYRAEPRRGYGPAMHDLLPQLHHPGAWQTETRALFGGEGSFGNGAAMRASPLGAYFADDLAGLIAHARRSAEVTHTHAEGVAGAIAVAAAASLAQQARNGRRPEAVGFMEQVLACTPESEVAAGLRRARDLKPGTTVRRAAEALGSGQRVTAQDTVPFAIWSAAWNLDDYERAICQTVCGLGDIDTTCAMVGGIVVMLAGVESIPAEWRQNREPLPTP